jgi:hypothetical protein
MSFRPVRLFIAVATLAAVSPLAAQIPAADDPSSKLTSPLAALSQAVSQDSGRVGAERVVPGPRLSVSALPQTVQDAVQGGRMRLNDVNEVQVYILMSAVSDERLAQLKDAGVTIEITDTSRRRVQARIPASRLRVVAALPFVDFIRLPAYARHSSGAAITEGDRILHADDVRKQLGLDGTGVRVGVLSDGLKGVFAADCDNCGSVADGPIATGDLPDAVGVRSGGVLVSSSGGIHGMSFQENRDLEGLPGGTCAFAGAGAEGTALLEVVHDLAPGAQLSFANADTDLAFESAVNFLASTNDVVVDDLGFYGDAYDGTSVISSNTASALNNPSYPIRTYVTSVGNAADEHYIGAYADSRVDGSSVTGIGSRGHLHLFQRTDDTTDVLGLGARPYNVISLPRRGEVVIFLTWDDPMGGSSNNYDLYLVEESSGRVVGSSTDLQRGAQDPVEVIDFTNRGSAGLFHIVVQNVRDAAQPKQLNLFSFEPECASDGPRLLSSTRFERHNYNTASRSVSAQSDAGGSPVSVISVGAICSASTAAADRFSTNQNPSCSDTTNSTLEFFSSRGPTLDGRQKPDISAIDGVSVTGAGGFPATFFGTSAAAPHVAGIAALAIQASPCLLQSDAAAVDAVAARTTLRNLIVNNAVSLNESGLPDNLSGAGRADAAATIRQTLPVFSGTTRITVDAGSSGSVTLTPAQLGFTDPSSCALTRLTWTGGCGTGPGSTMTCPRGTTRVSVAASNNGVSFSAPVDLQITVR